jgi:hypothetical protein
MHWGTFGGLTDEPLDEPPKRLADALARSDVSSEHFFLMRHGETRLLKRDGGDSLAAWPAGSVGATPLPAPSEILGRGM